MSFGVVTYSDNVPEVVKLRQGIKSCPCFFMYTSVQ